MPSNITRLLGHTPLDAPELAAQGSLHRLLQDDARAARLPIAQRVYIALGLPGANVQSCVILFCVLVCKNCCYYFTFYFFVDS